MIGEVTEKVLASIADSAGSLPDDYIGSDGLLYCGQCNTRKEREIIWFDGKPKKVPVMCKCRAEEERLKKEQMQKEEEMRSIQRAKVSSMMDDTFRTACFANYQIRNGNERHLKVAKKYCIEFSKMYERNQGLLFWGTVGTDMRSALSSVLNLSVEDRKSVV